MDYMELCGGNSTSNGGKLEMEIEASPALCFVVFAIVKIVLCTYKFNSIF